MIFVLLSLLLTACVAPVPKRFVAPDFQANAPRQVAVLPMDNWSTDLVGPKVVRNVAIQALSARGYTILPPAEVDDKLRSIGITDGGQLPAIRLDALQKALGVDGLFFGALQDFAFTDLGFFLRRKVVVHMWFVRASTGEKLWDDVGEGVHEEVAVKQEEVKKNLTEGMAQHWKETATSSPLMNEARQAIFNLFAGLPGGPPMPPPMPPPAIAHPPRVEPTPPPSPPSSEEQPPPPPPPPP